MTPKTPQEPGKYCLKIKKIEAQFLGEIKVRRRLGKKMKRFNTITKVLHTLLIGSKVITGKISIAVLILH